MSQHIKAFVVIGLVALVAACGAKEEEPVIVEPVYEEPPTTKY